MTLHYLAGTKRSFWYKNTPKKWCLKSGGFIRARVVTIQKEWQKNDGRLSTWLGDKIK